MCGIVGIHNLAGNPICAELLRGMCNSIVHRGPDDEGYFAGDGTGLGMRRLAIIDVAGGQQPICNEDASIWIVFNGEIYNYRELRAKLEKRGHRFRTQSDTEVIVHVYEEDGADCVHALQGMFAFAIWDSRARRLLLARDRLGIKPLFYAVDGDRLLFASEMKAILQDRSIQQRIDVSALNEYLTYVYVPSPKTILQSVRKLPPAHVLTCQDGRITPRRYWQLGPQCLNGYTQDDITEELRGRLQQAVEARLMTEVPLGAFLSGGIDSSAVVALMAKVTDQPVRTFSIGFDIGKFNELDHARVVAKHCNTDHHELVVRPDAVRILPTLVRQCDEPFADPSMIPTYYLAEMARQHVTVCLSGDGGDESFAGYRRYRHAHRMRHYDIIPEAIRRGLLSPLSRALSGNRLWGRRLRLASLSAQDRYIEQMSYMRQEDRERLFSDDLKQSLSQELPAEDYLRSILESATGHDLPERLLYVDFHSYLPEDILVKVDRMSMLNSLEVRVPFLDHQLLEFVAGIPYDLKLRGATSKYILKEALRGLLPDEILSREKHGFSVPIGEWFGGELYTFAQEILLDQRFASRGLFNRTRVEQLIREHREGIQDRSRAIYNLTVFELWCQTYLDVK